MILAPCGPSGQAELSGAAQGCAWAGDMWGHMAVLLGWGCALPRARTGVCV